MTPRSEQTPYCDWLGRTVTTEDVISAGPARALAATLDLQDKSRLGDVLPHLWHWLYFLPVTPGSELGLDGHAARGGFLPPVGLSRRMWAGGRFTFVRALRIGDTVERVSRITDITTKEGKSGPLVFVKVRHEIGNEAGIALTEDHDIVYRNVTSSDAAGIDAPDEPGGATFESTISPDPVLLFRYSALTFNGHRIHYDRTYVTEVENYPGLIVHGPLIATLLLGLLERNQPHAKVTEFAFRAVRPLFDSLPFNIRGRIDDRNGAKLWAARGDGRVAMLASAALAS